MRNPPLPKRGGVAEGIDRLKRGSSAIARRTTTSKTWRDVCLIHRKEQPPTGAKARIIGKAREPRSHDAY